MTFGTKINELPQAQDMAFFRGDLYLESPESFTPQEALEVSKDMIRTTKALHDAYRAEFREWPECERVEFFEELKRNDPEGFDYWFDILLGGGDPIFDHSLLPL